MKIVTLHKNTRNVAVVDCRNGSKTWKSQLREDNDEIKDREDKMT